MSRTLTVLALSAAIAGISLPALAMGPELDMLTGKVQNELAARDIDTSNIENLTVGQLAAIKAILEGDASEADKTNRIKAIVVNN